MDVRKALEKRRAIKRFDPELELSDAELEALRHFIRMKAHEGFE